MVFFFQCFILKFGSGRSHSFVVAGHTGIVYKCTNSFKRPRCPLPVHLSHRAGLKSGRNLYKNHEQGAVGDFGAVEQFRMFWIALRDYV